MLGTTEIFYKLHIKTQETQPQDSLFLSLVGGCVILFLNKL